MALDTLDNPTAIANFHLYFIYRLAALLGVEPDMSTYAPGRWFDMEGGRFTASMPVTPKRLRPEEAGALAVLSRLTLKTLGL